MSDTKRAPNGVLCSAECPMLKQGYCMEMGCPRDPSRVEPCAAELEAIRRRRIRRQRSEEEVRTVSGAFTGTGLDAFDAEVNGMLAAGWCRDGSSEVVQVAGATLLLQRMVRDVPGDGDDCETGE